MKLLLALIIFCTAGAQGQVLIYKMSRHSTAMGNGLTTKESAGGYVVVDFATGTAAEFLFYSRWPKTYTARSNTVTIDTVDAGGGKYYSVFSETIAGTNSSRYRFTSTAKGVNVSLDVGLADNQLVPRTMQFINRDVFKLGIYPFVDDTVGTLRIDLPGTQSANAAGRTLEEAIATIHANLAERGYVDSHP